MVRHAALALDARGVGGAAGSYAHERLPLFQPLPESQPVLPCLLRRLLQQVRGPCPWRSGGCAHANPVQLMCVRAVAHT